MQETTCEIKALTALLLRIHDFLDMAMCRSVSGSRCFEKKHSIFP